MTRDNQQEVEENGEGQELEEGENFCELCNEIREQTNWIECDKCETWICEQCHEIPEGLNEVFNIKGVFWFCSECEKSTREMIKSFEQIKEDTETRIEDLVNKKDSEQRRIEMLNVELKEKLKEMEDKLNKQMQEKVAKMVDKRVEANTIIAHKQTNTEENEQTKERKRRDQELKKKKGDIARLEKNLEDMYDKETKLKSEIKMLKINKKEADEEVENKVAEGKEKDREIETLKKLKERHDKEKGKWQKSDSGELSKENKKKDKEISEYRNEVKQYKDKLERATAEKKKAEEERKEIKGKMELQQKRLEENIIERSKINEDLTEIKKQRLELEEVNKVLEIELHQKRQGKIEKEREQTESNDRNSQVCRQYAKSRVCRFGEQCRYKHVEICNSLKKGRNCDRRDCKYSHEEKVMCRFDAQGFCKKGMNCKFVHKWGERDKQDIMTGNRAWKEETRETRERQRPFFEEGYRGQGLYHKQQQESVSTEKEEIEKTMKVIMKQIKEELKEELDNFKREMTHSNGNFWMPMHPQTQNYQLQQGAYVT